MKTYEATEQAYKNGYEKGYFDGYEKAKNIDNIGDWKLSENKRKFLCNRCGFESDRYSKFCPECGSFNGVK